jgi:hypothetical protein
VKAARSAASRRAPWTEIRIRRVGELAVGMLQFPYPSPVVEMLRSGAMKRAQAAIQAALPRGERLLYETDFLLWCKRLALTEKAKAAVGINHNLAVK